MSTNDSLDASGSAAASVAVGHYRLEVGSPEGAFALYEPEGEDANARPLAAALRDADTAGPKGGQDVLGELVEDASDVTARCEKCLRMFNELAQGRVLDPKLVSDEIESLLGLLARLDRAGRHKEALRLARDLAALLALILRWLDLVRSLQLALRLARQVGDRRAEAWALHEIGSLHLAAGNAAAAAERLREALRIREELGGYGRCPSRHNLDAARRDLANADMLARTRRGRRLRLIGTAAVLTVLLSGGAALGLATTRSHRAAQPIPIQTARPTATAVTHRSTTPATSTHPVSTRTVDTAAPTITLSTPADGSFTNVNAPTFTGVAGSATGDSLTVTIVITNSAGQPAGGSPLSTQRTGSSFSTSSRPLADGSYGVFATQTDAAGHPGTSPTRHFTVDTTAPNVSLACGSPTTTSITCSGTASEPDQRVTITISPSIATAPAPIQPAADGSFSLTLDRLASSTKYTLVASQLDKAGNNGLSVPITFTTQTPVT